MALKVGDNILITLDDNSKRAYVLSAVILSQHEYSFVHADSVYSYMSRKYPNLQIDYRTTLNILRALSKEGTLIRVVSDNDDPIYGFNPDYLKPKK